MDKPKKEPALLHQKPDSKLCLSCGFPNRDTDTQCMYCQTSLVEDEGLISWIRQTYYILRWRWQLKRKRHKLDQVPQRSILTSVGYFSLGALLSGAGVYLFTSAVSENSFTSGMIAILFLFYGFFTIKALLSKKNP